MIINNNFYKLLLFIFTAAVILTYFFFYRNLTKIEYTEKNNPLVTRRNFALPHWRFSIRVPNEYLIKEASSYIDLYKSNKKINISKNGTNFDNVKDYVKDFDSKRTIIVESEKKLDIKNYYWLVRVEYFPNLQIREKVYLIYLDHGVYTFSTQSSDLYNDLDQIVQSFKYLPTETAQ